MTRLKQPVVASAVGKLGPKSDKPSSDPPFWGGPGVDLEDPWFPEPVRTGTPRFPKPSDILSEVEGVHMSVWTFQT